MADTDPFGWRSAAVAEYDNADTAAVYRLSIALRYGPKMRRGRIPLTITTVAPDSAYRTETFAFPVRGASAPASAATVESIPYRDGVHLSQQGVYRIIIEPAEPLQGVEAAGIIISKKN